MTRAFARPLSLAAAPLLLAAIVAPQPALADARLSQVMYDEGKVFRLEGKLNVQASIVFGKDEVIENVAIGNSQTWQVTPNMRANILFVKPLEARATTNLTVVTNKRTYLFDLVASPSARMRPTTASHVPPMASRRTARWRPLASATALHSEPLIMLTSGSVPASKPICVPVSPNDW